jgi:hypothetical protein
MRSLILLLVATVVGFAGEGLPQCLIIGAQKSGTTALSALLRQHPQVVDRPGEMHFFDIRYEKGVEWYKAQFPAPQCANAVRIDKSPYYLFHPLAPQRAFDLLPQAKIIVLIRNPIDRAYSHYWMNMRSKIEPLTFEEAIEAEGERLTGEIERIVTTGLTPAFCPHRQFSYLTRGAYVDQLERWFAVYPREQFLIITHDDFCQSPQKVLSDILRFLNLPEYRGFCFNTGVRHHYPRMDACLRAKLREHFSADNERLEQLLGRKLNWN